MFFLEFPCFFHDPVDVGNLISGSPAFCIFHYIFHYIQNNNFTVLQESQKFYYNYLLCAVCPVKLAKPTLRYIAEEKVFHDGGADNVIKGSGFTTEANDVSNIIPTVHSMICGSEGVGHSSNYEIANKQTAYIDSAKLLVTSVIDLLANGAEKALEIKKNFKAPLTKESYIQLMEEMRS